MSARRRNRVWTGALGATLAISCMGATPSCGRPEQASTEAAKAPPSRVPHKRTEVAKLGDEVLRHQEVARIDQELHPDDDYQIAIDAWISNEPTVELAEVRMWWVDTGKGDERSPFGRGVRRHIDIEYERRDARSFAIHLAEKERVFSLEIVLADDGVASAFAPVQLSSGERVDHCRVDGGRLVAKTVVGLPVGLDRLEVSCVDDQGQRYNAAVVGLPR